VVRFLAAMLSLLVFSSASACAASIASASRKRPQGPPAIPGRTRLGLAARAPGGRRRGIAVGFEALI
jgi:hypothetical protein